MWQALAATLPAVRRQAPPATPPSPNGHCANIRPRPPRGDSPDCGPPAVPAQHDATTPLPVGQSSPPARAASNRAVPGACIHAQSPSGSANDRVRNFATQAGSTHRQASICYSFRSCRRCFYKTHRRSVKFSYCGRRFPGQTQQRLAPLCLRDQKAHQERHNSAPPPNAHCVE